MENLGKDTWKLLAGKDFVGARFRCALDTTCTSREVTLLRA